MPRRKDKMKFISLFAGIGGFDLGLERAGMQCVGQVEINPFCQRVLAHHWPEVKRIGDIRNVNGTEFGAVDLVCGGFPCQPFSHAGKRRGKEDDRYLWPEMLRVIKAYRPAWVLGENVAGIVSMALDTVLSDLEAQGYQCEAFIIPACAVDAKHERKRVYIVARRRCEAMDDTESRRCGFWNASHVRTVKRDVNTPADAGEIVADTERVDGNGTRFDSGSILGQRSRTTEIQQPCRWLPEPGVGRVANGVPGRVDRLRSLGNAVVPQVVEVIGRAIRRAHIVCAECAPENTSEARLTAYNTCMVASTRKCRSGTSPCRKR